MTYYKRCYDYTSTPTPGHISHASTAVNSANAAIRNHVCNISGSQLPLELDSAVMGHSDFSFMKNKLLMCRFHYT